VGVAIVYGMLLAWLLAGMICAADRRWAMFIAGFFTFGLAWIVGAVWGRPWRRLLAGAALVAVVAALFGGFGARPAPVLGLDSTTLQRSVGGELAAAKGEDSGCQRLAGRDWRCHRYDDSASSWLDYRVHVNSMGCWRADGRSPARRIPNDADRGCVHLSDYVGLFERLV
jgi:hypothetical protein